MQIEVLKSKLHCVTVTEANLNYMGSITIDEDLMDAANLIAGEKVQIVDNNNGERLETYIIKGERGSSHTDTMSERITTQIRIIKNGNSGSSHIEIYP